MYSPLFLKIYVNVESLKPRYNGHLSTKETATKLVQTAQITSRQRPVFNQRLTNGVNKTPFLL